MRQDGGVTQDVLTVGSTARRRDIRPGFVIAWVGVGLVFALSVMTVAVTTIGVWANRTVEADALMTRVQASETVMKGEGDEYDSDLSRENFEDMDE